MHFCSFSFIHSFIIVFHSTWGVNIFRLTVPKWKENGDLNAGGWCGRLATIHVRQV